MQSQKQGLARFTGQAYEPWQTVSYVRVCDLLAFRFKNTDKFLAKPILPAPLFGPIRCRLLRKLPIVPNVSRILTRVGRFFHKFLLQRIKKRL